MTKYLIKKIDEINWKSVSELTVHPSQKDFIEPNAESLLEAAYDKRHDWVPLALYKDQTLVGFTMIGGFNKKENYIWLDRFMLDEAFQGQGLSKPFMKKIIAFIKDIWDADTIVLSIEPANIKARRIYEQLGFKKNGMIDPNNNEELMEYEY